jgi:hypothetical protein
MCESKEHLEKEMTKILFDVVKDSEDATEKDIFNVLNEFIENKIQKNPKNIPDVYELMDELSQSIFEHQSEFRDSNDASQLMDDLCANIMVLSQN